MRMFIAGFLIGVLFGIVLLMVVVVLAIDHSHELNRDPTKEEWKAGYRRRL